MIRFIKSLFLSNRLFLGLLVLVVVFIVGNFFPLFFLLGKFMLTILAVVVLLDLLLLYNNPAKAIVCKRHIGERLSNGDDNNIELVLQNNYRFPVTIDLIDEIPHQFQKRDFKMTLTVDSRKQRRLHYALRPVKRGEYEFGYVQVYVRSPLAFIVRRFRFEAATKVAVYPSFLQMRKYELMAVANRLSEVGIKKIRRISNNKEFDQIREYVKGDDYRTINWKATARRAQYMVNQYTDEKSQQVYSLIDMGRTMKMPFEHMSLLDYAINTSLVVSNIALLKQDKAGLITFNKEIDSLLPASNRPRQMNLILENLYKQQTSFAESDYEMLYANVKRQLKQRSLLLLFTNFEGISSLMRQMPYLKRLSQGHLLVVIFFENTEVKKLLSTESRKTESIYIKAIAEKFSYEKKLIVRELEQYGIHSILSTPKNLTVNAINKYLELKAIGQI